MPDRAIIGGFCFDYRLRRKPLGPCPIIGSTTTVGADRCVRPLKTPFTKI